MSTELESAFIQFLTSDKFMNLLHNAERICSEKNFMRIPVDIINAEFRKYCWLTASFKNHTSILPLLNRSHKIGCVYPVDLHDHSESYRNILLAYDSLKCVDQPTAWVGECIEKLFPLFEYKFACISSQLVHDPYTLQVQDMYHTKRIMRCTFAQMEDGQRYMCSNEFYD